MAENKQKMDVRTYTRYVEKGVLKDSDVNSYLKSLPDETENAVWVDLTAEDAELDGDAEDSEELTEAEGVEGHSQTVAPAEGT